MDIALHCTATVACRGRAVLSVISVLNFLLDPLIYLFALCFSRPFLDTIYSALNCTENDYSALFALCLLYAMLHNRGV